MLLSIFDNLPTVRRSLAILTAVAASGNFISSAGLLGYQRAFTYGGYQRCLPAIIVVSFFAAAAPLYFLYCPPFSLGSSGKLRKASLFARSIAFELAVYAAVGAYLLVVTADLHAE